MACFHPIGAQQLKDGTIDFGADRKDARPLTLPCGRCIGCRLSRSQDWATRCMHEAQLHEVNSFITLTYNDQHYSPTLDYRDFQLFLKRLRKQKGPTRFFACGEYGDTTGRAHFHSLLFGQDFEDKKPCGKGLYQSKQLDELWGKGYASIGALTFQSAAYVARYAVKKINGQLAERYYTRCDDRTGELTQVKPEMGHMSLKPGIGFEWIKKNWQEVYVPRDGVITPGGKAHKAPKYYDKVLERIENDLWEHKRKERYERGKLFIEETRPERLRDREICTRARVRNKTKI